MFRGVSFLFRKIQANHIQLQFLNMLQTHHNNLYKWIRQLTVLDNRPNYSYKFLSTHLHNCHMLHSHNYIQIDHKTEIKMMMVNNVIINLIIRLH